MRFTPSKSDDFQYVDRVGDVFVVVVGLLLMMACAAVVVIGLTDPAGAEHQLRGIRESMDATLIGWLS